MSPHLLILGASARAAAFSARRAGFSVSSLDLFADRDLRECSAAQVVEKYPCGFQRLAREIEPGPWIYTGGLENYPAVIERLARERPLLGNSGPALRAIRDPFRLAETLHAHAFAFPESRRSSDGLPTDGSWLAKPLRGSGGQGIEPWLGAASQRPGGFYFQRRLEGQSVAAVYLAQNGEAELVGVSRQLIGQAWLRAAPFHYCGSIGPLTLESDLHERFRELGNGLASAFGLQGIFGVDALMLDHDLVLIEVNPRYPASAEVLERATGRSLVAEHVAACDAIFNAESLSEHATGAISGKAVLFAERDFIVSERFSDLLDRENRGAQELWQRKAADLPATGNAIRAGWPVFTILEEGESEADVLARLAARAAEFYAVMAVP